MLSMHNTERKKDMKKLVFIMISALCLMLPALAYAAENAAPEPGIGRIAWAMECAGKMPPALAVCLVLIAALILITVRRYYIIRKKGGKDE